MAVTSYPNPPSGSTDPITYEALDRTCVRTACGHLFNRESLRHWVLTVPSCPLCRADIDPENFATLSTKMAKTIHKVYVSFRSSNMSQLMQKMLILSTVGSCFYLSSPNSIIKKIVIAQIAINLVVIAYLRNGGYWNGLSNANAGQIIDLTASFAEDHPWLATGITACMTLAFLGGFWLKHRYQ